MTGLKCRCCGRSVWSSRWPLFGAHGDPRPEPRQRHECGGNLLFSWGEALPPWVASALEAGGWRRGELRCECGRSLGGFDFVSGRACECGAARLPPVHLALKRLDLETRPRNPIDS